MNMIFRFVISAFVTASAAATESWKFDFGQDPAKDGYTQVLPTALYSKAYASDNVVGYFGFENWRNTRVIFLDHGGADALTRDIVVGGGMNIPFYFSVNVPEGKYTVTFTIGDLADTANTTIKAESRRLLVHNLRTAAGEIVTRTFTVMRRDPAITASRSVSLDYSSGRENPAICLGWDRKLTFEFNGPRPAVAAVEITKVDTSVTLHLAGNSTVVEQEDEPWASWGQMVPVFFNASIVVNDLAQSGLTSANFIGQRRLEKICSVMKPGDYLFYEFGHNDSKNTGWETSMANSMKAFRDSAEAHNATMVFVTPGAGMITLSGTYPPGAPLTIKVVPNSGQTFQRWQDAAGKTIITQKQFLDTMKAVEVSYYAMYQGGTPVIERPVDKAIARSVTLLRGSDGGITVLSQEPIRSIRLTDLSGRVQYVPARDAYRTHMDEQEVAKTRNHGHHCVGFHLDVPSSFHEKIEVTEDEFLSIVSPGIWV